MPSHANDAPRPAARLLVPALILAAVLGAALLVANNSRPGLDARHTQGQAALRTLAAMRADLFAAAEAQRGAVLAETDEESGAFADAARAARERVASGLRQLSDGGWLKGQDAGEAFARAFAEYRQVDDEVLALAVQNTNLKALSLSFGRAWQAAQDLERALAPLPDSAPAWRARAGLLRVQALHAQHIMEKDEKRMDTLEADMASAAKDAREALAVAPDGPARTAAMEALERHGKATAELVRLSRLNTNVRSLALTLGRTTRLLATCEAALTGLEEGLRASLESRATR